jgi:hypothetical protein
MLLSPALRYVRASNRILKLSLRLSCAKPLAQSQCSIHQTRNPAVQFLLYARPHGCELSTSSAAHMQRINCSLHEACSAHASSMRCYTNYNYR